MNDLFGRECHRASPSLSDKIRQAHEIIDEAVERHRPIAIFAGLSGGHDSLTVAHIAISHLGIDRCRALHINTGIGIEQTRQFVRDTCRNLGWNLLEKQTTESWEAFVLKHGFPGPAQHNRMYQRLKERVVRQVVREAKKGHDRHARVMFITGIRAEESVKRAGYNRVESRVDSQVWINPIYYFTGQDKYEYIALHNLPRNHVVDTLGMSGECLCGAYAHKGELDLVRLVCPTTADRIARLEERARQKGFPWGWEDSPPRAWLLEQEGQLPMFAPMCVGCTKYYDDSIAVDERSGEALSRVGPDEIVAPASQEERA
jgi:3'-phosphoadenosine 5'-phosphosulfate sulfotransferase (PAPS reductase)/FAD synthetase